MHNTTPSRGPVFWAKLVQIVLLCVVCTAMLGAGQSRYERIGHELMCSCSCGQVLLECNHVGCPSSAGMIRELQVRLASGENDAAVLNWFATKYGATVLAAPIRGGFDNVAWIIPIAVFLLATLGTFTVVWLWKRRTIGWGPAVHVTVASGASGRPEDTLLRERIRQETEY